MVAILLMAFAGEQGYIEGSWLFSSKKSTSVSMSDEEFVAHLKSQKDKIPVAQNLDDFLVHNDLLLDRDRLEDPLVAHGLYVIHNQSLPEESKVAYEIFQEERLTRDVTELLAGSTSVQPSPNKVSKSSDTVTRQVASDKKSSLKSQPVPPEKFYAQLDDRFFEIITPEGVVPGQTIHIAVPDRYPSRQQIIIACQVPFES